MSGNDETYRGKLLLVIDLATDRVIWFTDELDQVLTPDDCAVQAIFEGDIPKQMTVRNCWNYRLRNQELKSTAKPVLPAQTLLAANRQAVLTYINDRSAQWLAPHSARHAAAERLRTLKLEHARQLIGGDRHQSELLDAVCVACKLDSQQDAANFIVAADAAYVSLLQKVEAVRCRWYRTVSEAQDAHEILLMRGAFDEALSDCNVNS